ncbi:NAD(P)H:quinone oxidoreductase, type IV, partial [Thamnocephalis sphaerospora]
RLYIIFHTLYHHVYKLAQLLQQGAQKVPGIDVRLFRVEEQLPSEVLTKMHAQPAPDVPVITANELAKADGFLLGTPTRYGIMSGSMKAFWDTTGGLWASGALRGKMAGLFFSTGGQHGGQETTALTFITTLAHHGVIFVPMGAHDNLGAIGEVVGGSYYGAGTVAGADGSRSVSQMESAIALFQGEQFADTLLNYVTG